jgi:AraC-like DNA-binding protein
MTVSLSKGEEGHMASAIKNGRLNLDSAFFGGADFMLYHAFGSNVAAEMEPHFHDDYVISLQLRGTDQCTVGLEPHLFEAGDIALINPDQPHTGNEAGSVDNEYLTLYVSRRLVASVAKAMGNEDGQVQFTSVRVRDAAEIRRLMLELLESSRVECDGTRCSTRVVGLAQATIRECLANHSNVREPRQLGTKRIRCWRIARVVRHLEEMDAAELSKPISLTELAEVAGVSRYHFLRRFTEHVGMTPGRYARMLRSCRAGRQLRQTDTSITEIALGVGFSDNTAFSRSFTNQMHITPSDYRRLGRGSATAGMH